MIRFTSILRTPGGAWLFTWADTGGPYRVVIDGREVARVTSPRYQYDGLGYATTPPPVEVVTVGEEALSEQYPSRVVVQWYKGDADHYVVEEFRNSAWNFVQRYDSPQWVYTHTTGPREDQSTVQLRVTPYNSLDDAGTPLEFEKYVVSVPASVAPDVEISYSGGSAIITEA